MKRIFDFYERGNVIPVVLTATAFLAVISIFGLTSLPNESKSDAGMRIEPSEKIVSIGETFEIKLVVESSVPVNVFAGELQFNPDVLKITSIDYNTSIADLWTELPWYNNGDGTLTFGGGTTREGGFQGKDTLLRVTFSTMKEGEGIISIHKPRILQHNGLGTDAKLAESKEAIFFVALSDGENKDSSVTGNKGSVYKVATNVPSTDLNADGKQSIADISIFMINIAGNDTRFDFNLDGSVDLKDLNILLGAG